MAPRGAVVLLRQAHLVAPALPGDPTGPLEIVGDGAERIRNRVHQVAPPVAVEVHRGSLVSRRHELRVPERTRPRTTQGIGLHVARLQDLQCRHQLGAEIALPRAGAGDGRERAHQGALAHDAAVVALHAPHRDDGEAIDAVLLLGAREHRRPGNQANLALGDAPIVDQRGEVLPDGRLELRLRLHGVDHRGVGLDARERRVESLRRDALGTRLRAQLGHAARERRRRLGACCCRYEEEQERKSLHEPIDNCHAASSGTFKKRSRSSYCSGLIPASRTSFPKRSKSARFIAPNCSAVSVPGSPPRPCSFFWMSGMARIFMVSA